MMKNKNKPYVTYEDMKEFDKEFQIKKCKKQIKTMNIFLAVLIPTAIILFILAMISSTSSKKSNIVAAPAKAQSSESEILKLVSYKTNLSSGHYVVGIDIPSGTYSVKAIKGHGNVYSSNLYNGGMNEIMGTKSEDVSTYDNLELPDGETLSVSDATISIQSENANVSGMIKRENPATKQVTLTPGNYTAGVDFDAGAYVIKASDGSGNVYSDNTVRGINAVMATKEDDLYIKEFKNVLLDDGTKLTIDGVTVRLTPSK